MKKVIIIGRDADPNMEYDGGEYGAVRVVNMIRKCFGEETEIIQIYRPTVFRRIINILFGQSYGMKPEIKKIVDRISKEDTELVFFNGSIYGTTVKELSRKGIKTVTFYHNVESKFYYQRYKLRKTFLNYILYRYISKQENMSTQYSKIVVTLNHRDSCDLHKQYGRNADFYSPTSYEPISRKKVETITPVKKYLLFVGGSNFANIEGMNQFIKNVLPKIEFDLYVIGNCCKELEKTLGVAGDPKLHLMGYMEDVENAYLYASAVVAPIYHGSGMKTKTVEALRYGKYIFGTPEAFEGIPIDYSQAGALCTDNKDFIININRWNEREHDLFNVYSYDFFLKNYTNEAVTLKFKKKLEALL